MTLTAAVRRSINCIELHGFLESVGAVDEFDRIFAEISGGDPDSLVSIECSATLIEGGEVGVFRKVRIACRRRVPKVRRSSWRPRSKRMSATERRNSRSQRMRQELAWENELERRLRVGARS
jgi:hypothetical protein